MVMTGGVSVSCPTTLSSSDRLSVQSPYMPVISGPSVTGVGCGSYFCLGSETGEVEEPVI